MPYDVRMPDGTIIKNVPDGTKKSDLLRKYQGHMNAQKPESFWQGVREGLVDTANKVSDNVNAINPVNYLVNRVSQALGYDPVATEKQRRAKVQARFDASPYRGSAGGRLTGEIAATLPMGVLPGGPVLQGAQIGALTSSGGSVGRVLTDAAMGGVGGKLGDVAGKRLVAPVLERVGRTKPARTVANAAITALQKAGVNARPLPNPQLTASDRMVNKTAPDLAGVQQNLQDAARLNLPYTLADASPELRALAGSVSRKSPQAGAMAEQTFGPRSRGQADRAVNAIDNLLAPVTNIEERAGQIRAQARAKAQPFYDAAYARPAPTDPDLAALLNRPAGKQALRDAFEIAQNRGLNPTELGFIVNEAGEVGLQPEVGRYVNAQIGNPREALGGEAPLDLVGFIRKNGGLLDQNGELSQMGLSNATRKGLGLTGLENTYGPLVSETGSNFDDAALRAWEAGYFPELTERPSVNQFLDALRGTYEGRQRRFLPQDYARIEAFRQAGDNAAGIRNVRSETGAPPVIDTSVPAGPDAPFPPMSAYGEQEVKLPTMQTLDLVKQALDTRLNSLRNPLTGKLDLEGDKLAGSVNDLLQQFKGRLDDASPDYWAARKTYQEGIAPRTALQQGYGILPKNNVPERQFSAAVDALNERTLPEAQRGYATAMADQVDKVRLSGNPYDAVYGSTLQQQKVAKLFPEGAGDFNRVYGLEGDMAKTATETLGGSPTQRRAMADQTFDALGPVTDVAIAAATGNPMSLARTALQRVADARRVGMGRAKADGLAPTLFNTDTRAALAYLDDLLRKQEEQRIRREAYQRVGGLLGAPAAIGAVAAAQP